MNSSVRGPRRARTIAAALLLVVFSSGALGAAALSNLSRPEEALAVSVSAATEWMEALDLSKEQRDGIAAILTAKQPLADSIVRVAVQELRSVMTSVDTEVRGILSPAQLVAFDDLRGSKPHIQAVRRTVTPQGDTVQIDTVRIEGRP